MSRAWTPEERKYIVENYSTMPSEAIAAHLERTPSSVRGVAGRLGLKSARIWTPEEYIYLDDNWGIKSLTTLAKNLGRSENAIRVKVFKRGLGAFLEAGEYITLNQLSLALGRGCINTYTLTSWGKNRGFPIKTKKVQNCSFRVVYLDEFWKWAEQHRTFIDFSKVEKHALGKEPDWVKEQRRTDTVKADKYKKSPWTPTEDKRLVDMLKLHRYTYHELAQTLGRTCGAIQRRICDLGIMERPIKADNHDKWTEEDLARFAELIKTGMSYDLMAEELGRSSKALRGRTGWVYRTENLDKIITLMGDGGWGDGAPEPTVRHRFRLSSVKQDLTRLCQLLLIHKNEMDFDGYWQKSMCMCWDDIKGCTAGEFDCDSCGSFRRIREQVCAQCGGSFWERKENRFCAGCRQARKKQAQRKFARSRVRD